MNDSGVSRDMTDDPVDPNQLQEHVDAFTKYRSLLFSIAYRMLGSATESEDMLQETYLRWQQMAGDDIRSPRAMLVTIVSRLCINHLQSARVQREEYFGQWLPEPLLTAPALQTGNVHEIDDSLSMAFLVMLERLNPVERATLLLHDVFDYDYSEIATILARNEAACRQTLRRARQRVEDGRPRFTVSPEEGEQLMRRFLEATASGDMGNLMTLLSTDIVLYSDGGGKAAAVPNIIDTPERVAALILGARKKFVPEREIRRIVQINGRPGVVGYVDGRARSVLTVDVDNGLVSRIYIITNPEKLRAIPELRAVN
jgi:RNA polymerase sigma-70 factor, ECF subfamily